MTRHLKSLRRPLARSAIVLASFTVSAACLCTIALIFGHASSDPFLRDSAQARLAVARCDALGNRGARDRCVHRLVVEASGRDADVVRLTAVTVVERRDDSQ